MKNEEKKSALLIFFFFVLKWGVWLHLPSSLELGLDILNGV